MNIPIRYRTPVALLLVLACISFLPSRASAQTSLVQPRITQAVDESKLTVLRGNTHPLARPQFDRGAAPADLPAERMQLVLKRSPAQEATLEKFMAEQQDQSSPNYHKWLTPAEFGREFGAADQDVQTITSWLESHGFQVSKPLDGRSVIEFSGNAAQVKETFHTEIHKFVVNGEEHWANTNDPSIPTALTAVVAGVNTLHNFFPKPSSRAKAASARNQSSGGTNEVRSNVTFTTNSNCGLTVVTDCFGLGPADFGIIYNVTPLWNAGIDGTGQTIAVVTDSNIVIQDDRDFRSIFGLPAKDPVVTVNGSNPGLNSDEIEAILDVEWSGAVARNANIDLVVSASTNSQFGGDLSDTFIVNENPPPSILSESFGACELSLGTVENGFLNSTWSQAATEGITVLVSSGDNGSAACDIPTPAVGNCGFSAGAVVQIASCGLAVNGLASTPFNIAVGGTEFNDIADPLTFWSANNTAGTQASALSYIPERTYNDSCADPAVVAFFLLATAEAACNNSTVQNQPGTQNSLGVFFDSVSGGSGGKSNCTTFDGTDPLSCTGGYAKPSWQVVLTPADGKRDLPDVSLFAGDGTISGSFYVVCNRDFSGITGSCNLSNGNSLRVGGTSVSTQVFAGIMALVDQKNESKEGNANTVLYPLAQAPLGNCNSAGPPSATCVFNDVRIGTIAMPCSQGTANCVVNTGGDLVGVLSGFSAGTGYDLATGLGSVNAANLVNASSAWANTTSGNDFTISAGTPTPVASPGGMGTVTVTVTANGTFNGMVTFACSALPSETTCSGPSVTGSGQSTITFQTTAPSTLTPTKPTARIGLPGAGAMLALVCLLSISLMWMGFSDRNRRWTAVLALAAFAMVFASVGCGGGGGGSVPPPTDGTPVGTTNVVITATSGSIQRSVSVAFTVN